MIPHDIAWLQPESVAQAVEAWQAETDARRTPRWFSGGTELVTGAREHTGYDVLIDLKQIPEFCTMDASTGTIGAGVRASTLADQNEFPLLANAAGGVGDRTVRNSITLGGNICGMLPYREAVLPLLLWDAEISIAGPGGIIREPITRRFAKRLLLEPGEFLLAVHLPDEAREPGFYDRRTRDARVDYPLVTLCLTKSGGELRFAASGVHGYPVRSSAAEQALAGTGGTRGRAERAAATIPDRVWEDFRASAEYRQELFVQSLARGLEEVEE